MKSLYFTVTISLIFCLQLTAQTWQQKSSLDDRFNATAFSIGSKGYVATGTKPSGVSSDLKEYDPTTNSWLSKASFPGNARETAVSFSYQNFGFVGLGWNGGTATYTDFYKYDQNLNTWSPISSFPGSGGRNGIATAIGSKAYVSGGVNGYSTAISTQLWEYDILLDTWTQKASMPFNARVGAVAFSKDSLVYFGLGHNFSSNFSDLWAYNTSTNTWSKMSDFPGSGRLQASVFEINGNFIVGGGHQINGGLSSTLNDYYEYNPSTNTWSTVIGFSDSRRTNSEGFSINGKGYLVCGRSNTSSYLNNLWEYSSAISVSITENKTKQKPYVSFFPNPSDDQINIDYSGDSNEFTMTIFNSIGSIVLERFISLRNNSNTIDLKHLENGNYYYRLYNQKENFSGQIVIKR